MLLWVRCPASTPSGCIAAAVQHRLSYVVEHVTSNCIAVSTCYFLIFSCQGSVASTAQHPKEPLANSQILLFHLTNMHLSCFAISANCSRAIG